MVPSIITIEIAREIKSRPIQRIGAFFVWVLDIIKKFYSRKPQQQLGRNLIGVG
jgi:hypothetical protein